MIIIRAEVHEKIKMNMINIIIFANCKFQGVVVVIFSSHDITRYFKYLDILRQSRYISQKSFK